MSIGRTGLTRRCSKYSLGACGVVLVAAGFAGLVRVLPWLADDSVPLGVAAPFVRTLLSAALEASLALGLPVGFALAAHEFRERGEAHALYSLGVSPGRLLAGPAAIAFLFAGLVAASAPLVRGDPRPGSTAARLLAAAEPSCPDAAAPGRVPLVGLARVCDGGISRIVGRVGERYAPIWFSARSVRFTPQLEELELADAHVLFRGDESIWTISVARARVLSEPIGGGRGLPQLVFLAIAAACTAVACARRALVDDVSAVTVLGRAAVACIASWVAFERSRGMPLGWMVSAACVPGAVLVLEATRWLERYATRFRRVAGTSGE